MELVSDRSGSMSFGWVGPGVYLVRASGEISASLGMLQLSRLEVALEGKFGVRYFCDSRDVKAYDLLARDALLRFVQSQRARFAELVMLTWAEGISAAGRAFSGSVGEPLVLLSSSSEFDRRLFMAAPRIREVLSAPTQLGAAAL